MRKAKKLSLNERVKIRTYLECSLKPSVIAKKLGRARSTITRELNRWGIKQNYQDYDPDLAHWTARQNYAGINLSECKLEKNKKLLKYVIKKLKQKWSPEQISNRLKTDFSNNKTMSISHESIYKFIYMVATGQLKKNSFLAYVMRRKKGSLVSVLEKM